MPLVKPHYEALRIWPFAENSDPLNLSFHTKTLTRIKTSEKYTTMFSNFQGRFTINCTPNKMSERCVNGRFCRPGLYHPQVRKQVLKLLLVQIGIRQTHHLIRSLVKWPLVELTLFLAELMACMPHQWYEC